MRRFLWPRLWWGNVSVHLRRRQQTRTVRMDHFGFIFFERFSFCSRIDRF